jgi:DNA invertase Pin-like site-specific DNA recombinase
MRRYNRLDIHKVARAVPKESPSGAVRAAIYVRVSTREQAERWSLPAQKRILKDFAERQGWEGILYDEGPASAEKIDGRPVLQQLLTDITAGQIDIVVVIEWERLCRASDLRDFAIISSTMRNAGVRIATPERTFDLGTAEDDFDSDLHGILSKREKRKLLERTARGLAEAKDAGRWVGGGAPTGYIYDKANQKLVPDPSKIPLVKRVFESDLSHWQLHKQLGREGISLPYTTIEHMRGNPAYLGLRPNSKGELIKADWSAILDRAVWDRQQQRRLPKVTRRSSRAPGPAYLLSGMVRCSNCGGPVTGRPLPPSRGGTPLHIYKCYKRPTCPTHGGQLPGWLVDLLVTDALTEYVKDRFTLKQRYDKTMAASQGADAVLRREELHENHQDLEERQAKLLDAVERDLLDAAVVRRRQKEIQAAQQKIRKELEAFDATDGTTALPSFQAILGLTKGLPNLPKDHVRKLLEYLAGSVKVDPRKRLLVVTWRLGGEIWYQAPRFRGGLGRRLEGFIAVAQAHLSDYRL